MPHSTTSISTSSTTPLSPLALSPSSPTTTTISPSTSLRRSLTVPSQRPPPNALSTPRRKLAYLTTTMSTSTEKPSLLRTSSAPRVTTISEDAMITTTPPTPTLPAGFESPTRERYYEASSLTPRRGYHRAASPPGWSSEAYPSSLSSSSSPSTPTSLRSRSPSLSSITSLETIPDSPDAELEAAEKAEAEAAERREQEAALEDKEKEEKKSGGRRRRERKRWSVCGGETRVDLELETIWEEALSRRPEEEVREHEEEA